MTEDDKTEQEEMRRAWGFLTRVTMTTWYRSGAPALGASGPPKGFQSTRTRLSPGVLVPSHCSGQTHFTPNYPPQFHPNNPPIYLCLSWVPCAHSSLKKLLVLSVTQYNVLRPSFSD